MSQKMQGVQNLQLLTTEDFCMPWRVFFQSCRIAVNHQLICKDLIVHEFNHILRLELSQQIRLVPILSEKSRSPVSKYACTTNSELSTISLMISEPVFELQSEHQSHSILC